VKIEHRRADIVVAGGGVAGVTAAIAAARMGLDTLIAERHGFLGGMFTGGNMTVLNCPPVGGIGKEIVDTLVDGTNVEDLTRAEVEVREQFLSEFNFLNNLKDIPTMWTTGEAAGGAAALSARSHVTPRKLDPRPIQERLRAGGALVSRERAAELERTPLPSGRTVKEFYERLLADMRVYWRSRGEDV